MARLSVHLLGPLQVTQGGESVTGFESDKARALLAYLAVETAHPHRREKLAGLLWPDWPEQAARANLRRTLANLRQVIGDRQATPPFLLISRQMIQFNSASDAWIDVTAFTDLLQAKGSSQQTIHQLEQAIELYRGDFLEGFSIGDSPAFEEWTLLNRERLYRLVMEALHRLADCHERCGEYERGLQHAWRQVELDPWREKAHRQLMRLLTLSGQRGAALTQYETCRRLLAEELGVEPAAETTKLYEQIREGTLEVSAPSLARPSAPPHNLPAPFLLFVGREAELAEVKNRLQDPGCRLLTLVGPGGSGKTRLALEVAVDQIERFAHGVYLVPLAPLQSAETIVPAVAQALNFTFYGEGEPQQQLLDYLRQKTMLLVMDNFEHLLDGVGVVIDILKTAPDIKILATSQARLNVQGEHLFPIAGMDFPVLTPNPSPNEERGEPKDAVQYNAVKLFLQSARRTQPGFELTTGDLTDVARICRLVQGMPLGILLAAAWMGILTPAHIAAEIERSLDFLETDWQDMPERQRSLRAVFAHSWNLLTERDQEVFQGLSVFRGGFTREAAQQVTGASLHELKAFVDKSFLHRMSSERCEVHELLRQYAAEKLDGSPVAREAAHDRHSAYYASALQQWEADLKGSRQQTALAEIEADHENVRAAWYRAVEQGQVERLDQAMEGLELFYQLRGRYEEGKAALRAAASFLAAAASLSSASCGDTRILTTVDGLQVWVKALVGQSDFCWALGHRELAAQFQQQALTLLERPELADQDTRFERALLFQSMGRTVLMSDYERGRQLHEEALTLYRELDDQWRMANVLHALGRAAYFPGAADEAKQRFEESLTVYQTLGDQSGIAGSMAALALVALYEGHFEEAERLARQATRKLREHGNRSESTFGLDVLGCTLEGVGKFAEAHSVLEECLAIHIDLGRRHYTAYPHASLSRVSLHLGWYEEAQAHAQTGLAVARETGVKFAIGHTRSVLGSVALAQGAYAEAHEAVQESVAVYQEIGHRDDLSQAIGLLGYAARGLGDLRLARGRLAEALRLATESRSVIPLLWVLPMIALLLADQGEVERSVELYALASRYPLVANSCWFEDVAGQQIAAVAASLPPDVVVTAKERGRSRDLEATVTELLGELGE